MFFPCFIPDYDAVFHAQKIAKRDCPFLLLPDFGRITRPHTPHFSALDSQNSTSAPLFRYPDPPFLIPQNTFWDIPFCHLGYPISPFGVYFRHICAQCTARFSVCLLRFRCTIYAFSLSIRKIDLAPFCIFAFLHFGNFDDVPSSKELTLGLPQIKSGILSLNRSFVILHFCVFAFLHFANAKLLPFGN